MSMGPEQVRQIGKSNPWFEGGETTVRPKCSLCGESQGNPTCVSEFDDKLLL